MICVRVYIGTKEDSLEGMSTLGEMIRDGVRAEVSEFALITLDSTTFRGSSQFMQTSNEPAWEFNKLRSRIWVAPTFGKVKGRLD